MFGFETKVRYLHFVYRNKKKTLTLHCGLGGKPVCGASYCGYGISNIINNASGSGLH